MEPEGRLAWRRFAGGLPCTPLLGDGVSQSWGTMGPDTNRHSGCQAKRLHKPLRGLVSSRLSWQSQNILPRVGGMSASWPRIGILPVAEPGERRLREPHASPCTQGAMLEGCLTKKEGHQIRQCRDSGSSPDARVATWSRHTRTLQAGGGVNPDDIAHQHGHGRWTTLMPQHLAAGDVQPGRVQGRGRGCGPGNFWHFNVNVNVNNKERMDARTALQRPGPGLGLSGCSWQASGIAFLGISHPHRRPCPAWPRARPENSDAGTDRSCHHCNPSRRPCPLEGRPGSFFHRHVR